MATDPTGFLFASIFSMSMSITNHEDIIDLETKTAGALQSVSSEVDSLKEEVTTLKQVVNDLTDSYNDHVTYSHANCGNDTYIPDSSENHEDK